MQERTAQSEVDDLDPDIGFERPTLYAKQFAAVYDPRRYSLIEASTKSGKTHGCLVWLFEKASTQERASALTSQSARGMRQDCKRTKISDYDMPAGSRPGERRGGRKKGSVARKIAERRLIANNVAALIQEGNGTRRLQNASTEEQAQSAAREIAEARARQVPLAKDALSTFLGIFMGRASFYQARGVDPGTGAERNTNANEDKFEKYARLSVEVAKALAPYQSPTYRAIVVAPPPQATQTKRRFTLAVYDNRNGNEIKAVFQTDGAPALDPRVIDAADEDSDKDENGSS